MPLSSTFVALFFLALTQAAVAQVDEHSLANRPAGSFLLGESCQPGIATHDLHANNVIARLFNTGSLFWRGSGNFYEVPAYGGANAVFNDALWIGGMVGGELHFAGTTYGPYEFFPGPLHENGEPPADCRPYDRIFVVSKRDLQAFDAGRPHTSDIEEWPWDLGAPVEDGDGDPSNYNLSGGDRPQVLGHQTAWWVMNDVGLHGASQSSPIRMEVQMTAWAVSTPDALDNTTFYRYRLVYRGSEPFTDVWFGLRVDDDLGDAGDDYVGSDTTLQMGYTYNGDDVDGDLRRRGYGSPPPAVGHVILQGPLVDGDGVDNDRDGSIDEEEERLGMTTFLYYNHDGSVVGNPQDAREMYNYLRAIWRDGTPVTFGGYGYGGSRPTTIMYPAMPPAFWSEENPDISHRNQPADRRYVLASGPFSMNPGDVQEIVIAIVWSRGADRIDSVARLREDAAFVAEVFRSGTMNSYPVPVRLPEPDVAISPAEVSLRLGPGERDSRSLTITNTGTADLGWTVNIPSEGFHRFLTVANGAGPLDPPDIGAFAFNDWGFPTADGEEPRCTAEPQIVDYAVCNDRPSHAQQVGPGRWGIHAGGSDGPLNGSTASYMHRSIFARDRTFDSVGPYDYEWRFTGSSVALRVFEDGQPMEVPFELWRTGMGTPDDSSDDVRMIPFICENACGGGSVPMVFDIGGDHPASGGSNDPASDWVYWMLPEDATAGDAGYRAYVDAVTTGTYDRREGEVLARQVIVGWNLGTAPPYPQSLPEPGTIFRIETGKNWVTTNGVTSGWVPPGESAQLVLDFGGFLPPPGIYVDTLRFDTRAPSRPEVLVPMRLEVSSQPTSAEATESERPDAITLQQNYPNPFNPATTIRFGLPAPAQVRLALYDLLGRRVQVLDKGIRQAGWHAIPFEAGDLPSGIYVYRLETNEFTSARAMLLLR